MGYWFFHKTNKGRRTHKVNRQRLLNSRQRKIETQAKALQRHNRNHPKTWR